MKKKLRLLVTKSCNKNCAKCANKNFDLDKLPIVSHYDYDEIIITGGEPFLPPDSERTTALIFYLHYIDVNTKRKVYIHTSLPWEFLEIIEYIDGVTYTLYTNEDVKEFVAMNHYMNASLKKDYHNLRSKSLRLKIFKGVELPKPIDLSLWNVEAGLKWMDNYSLPENEVFLRLPNI